MALKTKADRSDILDLVRSQGCTAADVLGWITQNRELARNCRAILEALDPNSVDAHLVRLRVQTYDEAVDRLVDQYRKMTSGHTR